MSLSALISTILSYLMAMLAMAFYTLMERKILGYCQLRKGPNKPGLMGLPQPFADAIKLFVKEQAKPLYSNLSPFMLAPALGLILALLLWSLYPHPYPAYFATTGILFFLCISSMNVYAIFAAGWSSNSKYALLGALRGVAQTISYEVSMSLILLSTLIILKTLDFSTMTSYQYSWVFLMILPISIMWFITNLAETNRTPFDFAEGESELVSGFNVEYSSGLFALIFMAEYTSILIMSLLTVSLFTASLSSLPTEAATLVMKTVLIAGLFVWVRATMPRMRYDHLMYLAWKCFLPLALSTILLLYPSLSLMN